MESIYIKLKIMQNNTIYIYRDAYICSKNVKIHLEMIIPNSGTYCLLWGVRGISLRTGNQEDSILFYSLLPKLGDKDNRCIYTFEWL